MMCHIHILGDSGIGKTQTTTTQDTLGIQGKCILCQARTQDFQRGVQKT